MTTTPTSAHLAPTPIATGDPGVRYMLRHTLATLAYRAEKVLRDAPPAFATLAIGDSTRNPVQILAHIGDLLDWGLWLARGEHRWVDSEPQPWGAEVERFWTSLAAFDAYLASDAPLGRAPERLFQGPIADALTHVGQIAMLRRIGGAPVRGENYAKAEIHAGEPPRRDGPRIEFD